VSTMFDKFKFLDNYTYDLTTLRLIISVEIGITGDSSI